VSSNDPKTIETKHSARLVIVDPGMSILLFRYHDEHNPPFWSTAGGQLVPGEGYIEAAIRELEEETGFKTSVGPIVHEREDVFAVARSKPANWIEKYFLVQYDRTDAPDRAGWTKEEHETIQDWRWWKLEEIRSSTELFLPNCLLELLESSLLQTLNDSPS